MLTKYAECEVLSVERADQTTSKVMRLAHKADFSHVERRPGYIYVRSRAISSRINDNFDGFPAEEIKKAYTTFMGKPVFVNHKNANHRRARGVIVAVALHEDTNPDGSPDTWAEVLMEVDAVRFPVLAEAVERGDIARTSMGTDVKYSICTACGNKAYTPADYCQHIPKMKGMKIHRTLASGEKQEVLVAEMCYGLGFFENSLLVEPPADPTAYVLGVESGDMAKAASLSTEGVGCIACANPGMKFTSATTPMCKSHLFQAQQGYDWGSHNFPTNISSRGSAVSALLVEADVWDKDYNTLDGCGICGDSEHSTDDHLLHPETYDDANRRAAAYKPHDIKASEVKPGDRLDMTGKTRVDFRHPRTDKVLVRTKTRGARSPSVQQWDLDDDIRVYREAAMRTHAYGEVKAPTQVDTLRAEKCPVCGDDEGYNGEQCNVCGYTQPPSQFQDPDLSKAKEMDLRQEQGLDDVSGPTGPEQAVAPQGEEDLQCTNCGEVFSAEGDSATGTDDDATEEATPTTDPEHPDDPKDGDGKKTDEPEDLDDLADLSDAELGLEDPHEEEPKAKDPDEDQDPASAPDPSGKGEGRVTPNGDEPDLDDLQIAPNMTCPVCGEGTLVPTTNATPGEQDLDEDDDPVSPKKVPPKQGSDAPKWWRPSTWRKVTGYCKAPVTKMMAIGLVPCGSELWDGVCRFHGDQTGKVYTKEDYRLPSDPPGFPNYDPEKDPRNHPKNSSRHRA